jgi:hypothetical protein
MFVMRKGEHGCSVISPKKGFKDCEQSLHTRVPSRPKHTGRSGLRKSAMGLPLPSALYPGGHRWRGGVAHPHITLEMGGCRWHKGDAGPKSCRHACTCTCVGANGLETKAVPHPSVSVHDSVLGTGPSSSSNDSLP